MLVFASRFFPQRSTLYLFCGKSADFYVFENFSALSFSVAIEKKA
jgi:hypothetical protein